MLNKRPPPTLSLIPRWTSFTFASNFLTMTFNLNQINLLISYLLLYFSQQKIIFLLFINYVSHSVLVSEPQVFNCIVRQTIHYYIKLLWSLKNSYYLQHSRPLVASIREPSNTSLLTLLEDSLLFFVILLIVSVSRCSVMSDSFLTP